MTVLTLMDVLPRLAQSVRPWLVSASVRTGLGRGPGRGASHDGPRLPYDVTVYGISIERHICYLRIAWDRYLIYNKELFCSVLFCSNCCYAGCITLLGFP